MRTGEKTKSVYILLTRTDTIMSRIIAAVTGKPYTHASLGLDFALTRLYSFGRLYAYFPFIGCFKREETTSGVYARFRRSPCALFELKVTEYSYDAICTRVFELERHASKYKYNFIGLFANYFGFPIRRDRHYFCSEFVADTLVRGDALRISRDPSLVRPSDFLEMVELRTLFIGTIETLDSFIAQSVSAACPRVYKPYHIKLKEQFAGAFFGILAKLKTALSLGRKAAQ